MMIGGRSGSGMFPGMGGRGGAPFSSGLPGLAPPGVAGIGPQGNGGGAPGGQIPGAAFSPGTGNGLGASSANSMGPAQEDVFGLLKDNLLRRFKVDIETDSTIAGDESQEKQDVTSFIESLTKFFEAWGPMVMQRPEMAPLASKILLFGVRRFRVGRELEEEIEITADKLEADVGSQQQKPPDPKVQAETIKLQGAQLKTQAEVQKSQVDAQTGQQEAAAKLQEIITSSQARIAEAQMKLAALEQAHGHKIAEAQMAHAAAMDQMQLEQQKAQTAQMPKWPVDPGKTQGF